jgi:voltage-gated potassium channel Kch
MTDQGRSRIGAARTKIRAPHNPLERRMSKFLREPPSIRLAASVIVTATGLVVVGAGLLMRVLDHSEYPTIWIGIWWALQTVTTVGYGDVTPHNTVGRVIAAFVMFEGIAFLSIITAAITSTFVARAAREQAVADEEQEQHLNMRFDELDRRLERIESALRDVAGR